MVWLLIMVVLMSTWLPTVLIYVAIVSQRGVRDHNEMPAIAILLGPLAWLAWARASEKPDSSDANTTGAMPKKDDANSPSAY